MSRRHWAVVILTAWAVSLGWLVKREFFRTTGERLAEAALAVPPGTVFFRIDLAGHQVGFASTTVDTAGAALRVTDVLLLEFPVLGRMHRTRARSSAVVNRALRLQTLDVLFDGDEGRFAAHGEVQGDSVLRLTLVSAGDSQAMRLRLSQPIVLTTLLPLRLAFGGALKPGRTATTRVFDPLELAARDISVTIAAESTLIVPDSAGFDSTTMAWTAARFDTVRAFRIEERSQGLTTNAWIDAQGRTVRVTGPVGVSMERTAYEIAYQNFRRRDTSRLVRGSAQPGSGAVIATTVLAAGAALRPHPEPRRVSGRPHRSGPLRVGPHGWSPGACRGHTDRAAGVGVRQQPRPTGFHRATRGSHPGSRRSRSSRARTPVSALRRIRSSAATSIPPRSPSA